MFSSTSLNEDVSTFYTDLRLIGEGCYIIFRPVFFALIRVHADRHVTSLRNL